MNYFIVDVLRQLLIVDSNLEAKNVRKKRITFSVPLQVKGEDEEENNLEVRETKIKGKR